VNDLNHSRIRIYSNLRVYIGVFLFSTLLIVAPIAAAFCDYRMADQFDGWGWDAAAQESCQPLGLYSCDYGESHQHDGWGWNHNSGTSCSPEEKIEFLLSYAAAGATDFSSIAGPDGALYVFRRTSGVWKPQSYHRNPDVYSVSVHASDGTSLLVGADGRCRADNFSLANSANCPIAYILDGEEHSLLPLDVVSPASAVAIAGDTAIVGIAKDATVLIYSRTDEVWSNHQTLKPDAVVGFGQTVALSGSTLIIGAYDHDFDLSAVHVYALIDGSWVPETILQAIDQQAKDGFGFSIATDGEAILVGSMFDDHDSDDGVKINAGSAYVFTRIRGAWSQSSKLIASDAAANDFFGRVVSIDGDKVLVGAYGRDSTETATPDSGVAYLFKRKDSFWREHSILTGKQKEDERFGQSVSVIGSDAMVVDGEGRIHLFRVSTDNEPYSCDTVDDSSPLWDPTLGVEMVVHCCDYQNATANHGWGWDASAQQACRPLDSTCDYSQSELYGGWGWNAFLSQSCPPI